MRARRSPNCSRVSKALVASLSLGFAACAPSAKRVEQAEVNLRVAKQFYAKNELPQALSNATKAKDADPKNAEIRNFLGLIHLQRGELDRAEKYFTEATSLDPKYSEAWNHRCLAQIQRDKPKDAVESCRRAVDNILYATPERAYHNMGLAYEKMGEREKAAEAFRKGLTYNKRFVMSLKALGELQAKDGRHALAVDAFEQGAKVCADSPKGIWQSECPETFYQMALSYLQLRRKDKAVASFQGCVEYSQNQTELMSKCQSNLRQYK